MRIILKPWFTALEIDGDIGIIIKFAFFSGLRGEEITYVHDTAICDSLAGCNCGKLHITDKKNGVSIIVLNRIVGQKHSYFTMVPTPLWSMFRDLKQSNKRGEEHCSYDGKESF